MKFEPPKKRKECKEAHGVKILDDFKLDSSFDSDFDTESNNLPNTSNSPDFVSAARDEKQKWLAYKNSSLASLGKGKRRSLGLAPQKLLSLSFDPIEAKVMLAEKYEAELAYHEAIRAGLILNPSTGKPRTYSAQAHALIMAAYDRCINDLMRYGYARVPEKEEDVGNEIAPVSITLTLSEEDMDDTLNEASEEGLIENTSNVRELVKDELKKFKVPLKVFKHGEDENEY